MTAHDRAGLMCLTAPPLRPTLYFSSRLDGTGGERREEVQMVVIRPATAGDREGIAWVAAVAARELRRAQRPRTSVPSPLVSARERARDLVAILDGEVVGSVQGTLEGDQLHIDELVVHPGYRRHGIARRLIESMAERAREGGCGRLALDAYRGTGVVRIFKHLGFHVVSQDPPRPETNASGPNDPVVYVHMERLLPAEGEAADER